MTDSKTISAELRLKRFLYVNSELPKFISGDPEVHNKFTMKEVTFNQDITPTELTRIPVLLESLSKENIPYKQAIFFALVALMRPPTRISSDIHELYTCALNLFSNNEDLFTFVKYFRAHVKNVPSGLKKIIATYYFRQEPMELLRTVTESGSYHGWSHKDLFKLIHYKTDNILFDLIIKYVLFGFEKAQANAGNTKEENDILDYLKKLRNFKTTEDEKLAVELFDVLNIYHVKQIPGKLIKSPVIWEALIPRLPLNELIQNLPKLYKMGFLKPGPFHDKVIEILSDKTKITDSKIQPIDVFIGLKNLEKGGKPKDPNLIKYLETKEDVETKQKLDPDYKKPNFAHQEPAKCTQILSTLQKTFQTSFSNLRPISKRVMITVEVQEKMNEPCLTTKNVTRIEAAAMVVLYMIKMNRNFTVGVFNGSNISMVQLEKSASIGQIIKKLKEANHDQPHFHAPFEWAKKNKKSFDLFINICTSTTIYHPVEHEGRLKSAFDKYCKELNLNETKFIFYTTAIHSLACAIQEDKFKRSLDLCGFDCNTLKVIEAFAMNLF